jgi:hypothetical protein
MPTPTYDLIATTTLAASSPEIVFGSLPQTYRDLVLVFAGVGNTDGYAQNTLLQINRDSSNTYVGVRMSGNGSSVSSGADTFTAIYTGGVNNGEAIMQTIQFMDYSATDKHKAVLIRDNVPLRGAGATSARFPSTSAITSFRIFFIGGNTFAANTRFSLYGIAS